MTTENIRLVAIISDGSALFAAIDDQEKSLYAVVAENSGEEEP